MNEWISIAANVGTAVAASLAFLALREMKQQRAQADKSKLLLSAVHTTLDIYWAEIKRPCPVVLPLICIPGEVGPIPDKVDTKENTADLSDQLNRLAKGVELELINAGLGPAIEVNIDWAIEQPISQLIKELNESNLGILLETKYHEGRCRQLLIRGKKGKQSVIFILGPGVVPTDFPYLLPYSNMETNKRIITIPHVLMLILCLMLAAKTINTDKHNLPRLHCNISFKDRAGRKHKDSFILEFEVSMIQERGLIPPKPNTICALLQLRLSLK